MGAKKTENEWFVKRALTPILFLADLLLFVMGDFDDKVLAS